MAEEEKRAVIEEFDLRKGLAVATFSGIMSACFSYGLAAGDPIKSSPWPWYRDFMARSCRCWWSLLLGGFTTNSVWCILLNIRNRSGWQYVRAQFEEFAPEFPQSTENETASTRARRSYRRGPRNIGLEAGSSADDTELCA